MIQDFAVEQDNYGQFDLVIDAANKVFAGVEGFETAIYVQIFLDRRATNQDITNPNNRQGWIGDLVTRNEGFEIGSSLWLKRQSRNTQIDINEIEAYIKDGFEHLITIGAIKKVSSNVINNTVEIIIQNSNDEINRYSKLWRRTNADIT